MSGCTPRTTAAIEVQRMVRSRLTAKLINVPRKVISPTRSGTPYQRGGRDGGTGVMGSTSILLPAAAETVCELTGIRTASLAACSFAHLCVSASLRSKNLKIHWERCVEAGHPKAGVWEIWRAARGPL